MALPYGISGVTNPIENHRCSMILPHCSILRTQYKLSQRTFHAHRTTESEISQTRQPQLFVHCLLKKYLVFQFIVLYGCRFVKTILCLTATMATMPLLPTESHVSSLKNIQHILRPTPSCMSSIFNFREEASTDILSTILCFLLPLLL